MVVVVFGIGQRADDPWALVGKHIAATVDGVVVSVAVGIVGPPAGTTGG